MIPMGEVCVMSNTVGSKDKSANEENITRELLIRAIDAMTPIEQTMLLGRLVIQGYLPD